MQQERLKLMKLEYRPETIIKYNSDTGEKIEKTNHYIYNDKNNFIGVIVDDEESKKRAETIVNSVNNINDLFKALNNLLSAISETDTSNNSTKITEALGLAEIEAETALAKVSIM